MSKLRRRSPWRDALTPRQEEVLLLIGDGYTYRQIGDRLGISVSGVRKIQAKLCAKLKAANKQELVVAARRYFMRSRIDG